ncbi:hypothetical protein Q7P37_004597 [Cladosporium fusiforme]
MNSAIALDALSSHVSSHASTPTPYHSSAEDIGTPSDGSQTSHTSSLVNESFANYHAPGVSNEAQVFLSDLSNYLALGCLTFEACSPEDTDGSNEQQDDANTEWKDTQPQDPSLSKLAAAGWIRIQCRRSMLDSKFTIYRIYVLPGDVGLRFFDRQNRRLFAALEALIAAIDVSPETWAGRYAAGNEIRFDQWATGDEGSLFYMFNKLPSPRPDPSLIKEKYTKEAIEDLLDPAHVLLGLKTPLYPYQRRSAALMLQRESVSTLQLDPRLEQRMAPDGSIFYYGPRETVFNRNPRYYETTRGGILAETMGLGKTLMCLALILATRNHLPKVPPTYGFRPVRTTTASLADMAVSAINRKSVPWKVEFERIKHASQDDNRSCIERLQRNPPVYEIPVEPVRWNRKTVTPPPQKKTLAATTIIVVPRNLCKQWHSEIHKHVDEGILRILLMEEPRSVLPPANELREYDVVLFSRSRFETEVKDGSDDLGRRLVSRPPSCACPYIGATRTINCHCVKADNLYESPLKHLHFKRLIIDEGHFFSSSNTTAVTVAKKLVTADHRWVVSGESYIFSLSLMNAKWLSSCDFMRGTPAKDLLGVEADMSAAQNVMQAEITGSRDAVLDQRRQFNPKEDSTGAIKSLGALASHFLRIRPWAADDFGERPAMWEEHIYRHEGHRKRTFSGFSSCLRRTLEAMVVKTQPEDVEQDIELPPLNHEVVRLEPSFYDKLTSNLFSIVLTANAVTSERTDADYLFHRNSAQARYQLIGNLRQSAFFWTGFSEDDVEASIKNGKGYLEKAGITCTEKDRQLLLQALQAAESILNSNGWKALSQSHELGLFVDRWPGESAEFWSFCGNVAPLLTGISQLLEAQKHVNEQIGMEDPGEGLAGIGIRALKRAQEGRKEDQVIRRETKPILSKAGINLSGEPTLKRRPSASNLGGKSAAKRTKKSGKAKSVTAPVKVEGGEADGTSASDSANASAANSAVGRKRRWSGLQRSNLAEDSPFAQSQIIGTTSAKLSYLTSQILKYHEDEKILVFYDGDNIAYYIAQMLELLHIKHEIYAKSLAAALKSEYVVRFNEQPHERVLLMDVKHAAFGLNISSASRIYFVNPVCRPNIEAQAIKRAHRIGQTRKVFVETLLLKGTIEEKMHERAKRMTNLEHHDVSHLEDDYGMREIIQGTRLLPVLEEEKSGSGQMAPLEVPQRLWGRPGWRETLDTGIKGGHTDKGKQKEMSNGIAQTDDRSGGPAKKKKKTVRVATPKTRTLSAVAIPSSSGAPRETGAPEASAAPSPGPSTRLGALIGSGNGSVTEEDEPMIHSWRRRSHGTQQGLVIGGSGGTQNVISSAAAPSEAIADHPVEDESVQLGPASERRRLSIVELLN